MAIQTINIGTSANKGDGDPLRVAFDKINKNCAELDVTNTVKDIKGSVFADDSTVLVDSVNGTLNASALSGSLPAIDGSALTGITVSTLAYSSLTGTPTTISGYGITDAYTKTEVDNAITSSVLPSGSAQSIDVVAQDSTVLVDSVNGTINATTLTGALPAIDGSALTGVTTAFSNITSTPTTLAGYGITDAATLNNMAPTGAVDFTGATSVNFTGATITGLTVTETDPVVGAITGIVKADGSGNISAAVAGTDYLTTVAFSDLTGKPTTLAGYGITDAAGTSSATTFTADVKFDQGVTESFATYNNVSGVVDMDCDHGHLFYVTNATGDITTNFTNFGLTAEYGTNLTVIINQGATPYEVTAVQIGGAAQTINWQGGSAPTGNANGIDSFSFTILNDGGSVVVALDDKRSGAGTKVEVDPQAVPKARRVEMLTEVDEIARSISGAVTQVSAGLSDSYRSVLIANSDGVFVTDEVTRVLFRVGFVADGDLGMQTGAESLGFTGGWEVFDRYSLADLATEAAEQAVRKLHARPAPSEWSCRIAPSGSAWPPG